MVVVNKLSVPLQLKNHPHHPNMKIFILAALVAVAAAVEVYPAYPAKTYTPAYPAAYKPAYEYVAQPYEFAYAVDDTPSYNHFDHKESGDGKGYVNGAYSVVLPDGRRQTVTYKADDYTGYVADVQYSGEYKHDYKPVAYQPAYQPAYKPAYEPAYKPAYEPAYKPAYPTKY